MANAKPTTAELEAARAAAVALGAALAAIDSSAIVAARAQTQALTSALEDAAAAAGGANKGLGAMGKGPQPAIQKTNVAVIDTSKNLKAVGGESKKAGGALKGMGAAGVTAAAGAAVAIVGIVEGLIKIGKTVIARDNLRATLDQVTRGRGAEALLHLDKLAKGLNMSVADASEQFVNLRKAGAKAATATALIKLRADLEAVGLNANEAQAQVDKALLAIRRGGDPSAVIAKTAKAFGAVGDGSNAAAKKAYTLEGILTSLLLSFEQTAAIVADALGPAMVDLARAFIEGFGGAEGGTGILMAVKDAMIALIPVAKALGKGTGAAVRAIGPTLRALGKAWVVVREAALDATQAIVDAWNSVSAAVTSVGAVMSPVLDALSSAFSGVGAAATAGWTAVSSAVFNAVGVVISEIDRVIQGTSSIGEAFSAIGGAIVGALGTIVMSVVTLVSSIVTALGDFGASAAAKNFIDTLVTAIKNGAATVIAAAGELASGVADAAKNALGIASPSKVAIAIGSNFGNSMSDAIAESAPPDLDYAMPDTDVDVKGFGKGSSSSSSSSSSLGKGAPAIHLTINVAGTNASANEIASAAERAIESALRRVAA